MEALGNFTLLWFDGKEHCIPLRLSLYEIIAIVSNFINDKNLVAACKEMELISELLHPARHVGDATNLFLEVELF